MVRVHIVQIVHIVPKSLRHVKVFGQFGHNSVVNVQIVQIVLIRPEHSDWHCHVKCSNLDLVISV